MLDALWDITLDLAPWLLLGMAIAGLLHGLLPRDFVQRHLRGRAGVAKAVALGVPLPLCSCGVIPTGLGLKKDGASNGASVGFLISTPQTGVDSMLVSASFLGWPFAIFKVLAAAVTGLVGGWIADRSTPVETAEPNATASGIGTPRRSLRDMIDHALDILRSIWHWLAFGIVVSALITVFVPDDFFAGLSEAGAVVPILAALAVSLPLYVCATASVPIAAALVASGMPTGAALVFLMAGPATNVATIGAVYRGLGARALTAYLVTIIGGSIGAGLLFDSLVASAVSGHAHVHGTTAWWTVGSALLLLALMGWFAMDDVRRWFGKRSAKPVEAGGDGQDVVDVPVEGMTCMNCVAHLEKALRASDAIEAVDVTLEPGRARVRGTIDRDAVKRIVAEAGYSVPEPGTA